MEDKGLLIEVRLRKISNSGFESSKPSDKSFFGMLGCRQFYLGRKGYHEPQKVENYCSRKVLRTTG